MEIKQLENSEVEIIDEIPAEGFGAWRPRALKRIGEDVEIPGFRKGHIPEDVLVKRGGEAAILEEMARFAVSDYYLKIVADKKIDAIGKPEITITKLAAGNPLGFTIRTAVLPIVNLPDVTTLVKSVFSEPLPSVLPTDEELQKAIDTIRKRVALSQMEAPPEKEEDIPLPELTDDAVKGWGPFQTVVEFTEAVKKNMSEDKRHAEKDKRRADAMDKILAAMHLIVPKILIESEQERMLAQFKDHIASASGLDPKRYFEHIKKSEDDIKGGWRMDAEKRVKVELTLRAIAKEFGVKAPDQEIDDVARRIKAQFPDANDTRAHSYARDVVETEKVFEFLEQQG